MNRYPTEGTVAYRHYNPGKFGHAGSEKSSLDNEQSSVGLSTSRGKVLIRQIAGLIARRIVTDHPVGKNFRDASSGVLPHLRRNHTRPFRTAE